MFYSSLKEQLLEFRKQASWILTEKKLSNQEEPDSYLVPVASCIIMGKKLTLSHFPTHKIPQKLAKRMK